MFSAAARQRRLVASWFCMAVLVLAGLTTTRANAAPAQCEGYDDEVMTAWDPIDQIDWLTDELEQCAKPNLERADDYYWRGVAYAFIADSENAIIDFTKAIALNPHYSVYYVARGSEYCSLSPPDIESGLKDWIKATTLNKDVADVAKLLQAILADEGFYTGPIDSAFGPRSQAAFRAYCAAGGPTHDSKTPATSGSPTPATKSAPSTYVTLEVCNRTYEEVYLVFAARKAPGSSTWTLQGWRNVPANQCKDAATFARGNLYLYAESKSFSWSGSARTYCAPNLAFQRDLIAGYTCQSGERLLGFYEAEVSNSSDVFTWTLTE